jgi:hypothetical protein
VDNASPPNAAEPIIERRELRFSPLALMQVIAGRPDTATSHGLPSGLPVGVTLLPQERRVDLVYGQASAARSFPLTIDALGMLLIAHCIRARIPLPRLARKEAHIGVHCASLVFHLEHTQAPVPEIIEVSAVPRELVPQSS